MSTAVADPPVDTEAANHELNGESHEATAAEPTDAEQATAESAEAAPPQELPPILPLAEREAQHYQQIRSLGIEVDEARSKWQASKEETKEFKKEFDELQSEMRRLVRRGPDAQRRLPLTDPSTEGETVATDTPIADGPPRLSDAYKSLSVSELGVSKSIVSLLEHHDLGTLGKLQTFWTEGGDLTSKKGFGGEKAAKVTDAYADYAVKHPDLWQAATAAADETAAEESGDDPNAEDPSLG